MDDPRRDLVNFVAFMEFMELTVQVSFLGGSGRVSRLVECLLTEQGLHLPEAFPEGRFGLSDHERDDLCLFSQAFK